MWNVLPHVVPAVTQRDRAVAVGTLRSCSHVLSLLMSLCVKKPVGSGGARGAGGGSTSGGESTTTAPVAGTTRAHSAGNIRDEDANLEHCRLALTADIIPLLITLMTVAKDDETLMVRSPQRLHSGSRCALEGVRV